MILKSKLPIHPNEFLYDNDTIENKTKIDKDYEETYGKIYKPIDIRYLKSKMYSVLKDMKTQRINFDDLICKVEAIVDENMKKGLSRQIFFSSLLHICNEYNTFVLNAGEKDNVIIIEKITLNK